jgi:hypothetical protein
MPKRKNQETSPKSPPPLATTSGTPTTTTTTTTTTTPAQTSTPTPTPPTPSSSTVKDTISKLEQQLITTVTEQNKEHKARTSARTTKPLTLSTTSSRRRVNPYTKFHWIFTVQPEHKRGEVHHREYFKQLTATQSNYKEGETPKVVIFAEGYSVTTTSSAHSKTILLIKGSKHGHTISYSLILADKNNNNTPTIEVELATVEEVIVVESPDTKDSDTEWSRLCVEEMDTQSKNKEKQQQRKAAISNFSNLQQLVHPPKVPQDETHIQVQQEMVATLKLMQVALEKLCVTLDTVQHQCIQNLSSALNTIGEQQRSLETMRILAQQQQQQQQHYYPPPTYPPYYPPPPPPTTSLPH